MMARAVRQHIEHTGRSLRGMLSPLSLHQLRPARLLYLLPRLLFYLLP
jgi:hypothetical protein